MMRPHSGLLLCLVLCGPALAESDVYGGSKVPSLSNRTTSGLIRKLERDFQACFQLEKVYRYDCYDDAYDSAAKHLGRNPAYAEVRTIMTDVGNDIKTIVEANIDPAGQTIKRGAKTYRPIKQSALPQAKADVIRSIEEAQTLLLRSPDGGDHYRRIAAALDSNKVLLRSAMRWIGQYLRQA